MTLSLRACFQPTVLLALALMAIIVMMILPMPAWILDAGLALSFALAILIFTTTLFIERPLDFSAFPTVLLASLMLRLSLNVSSTKLIIGEGHTGTAAAGEVIEGFAMFVMNGSFLLGLVVFCVLLIVNFMVITKGAARMAEVGARFALDGMPGKQLSIDADMSAGAIDHAEAKRRRETEQQETTFFGSLDGASKFVKGDAVAGLLITLLNLVIGAVIGTTLHGMPLGRAFETYAILTVGDGLVTQIPAVIISIASALLLARGGATGSTDMAFFSQLGRYPAALATVAVLLAIFAVVPGLPFLPFMLGALGLGYFAWMASRRPEPTEQVAETAPQDALAQGMGDILDLDDIHLEFAPNLVPMVLDPGQGLDARIGNMRHHVATRFGVILPEIRLTDDVTLPDGTYIIRIQGVERVRDRLYPDRVLALLPDDPTAVSAGLDVAEPVYGAPARWLSSDTQDSAALSGLTVINPPEVLATHLLEVIKQEFPRLLTLKGLRRLLDEFTQLSDQDRSQANRKLIDSLIPDKVPVELLLSVLRLLLAERVSIRNMPLILETVAAVRHAAGTPEAICEAVRQRLGFQLVAELKRGDGTVPLVQLDPDWEKLFANHALDNDDQFASVALPPEDFNRLVGNTAETLGRVSEDGTFAAMVTSARRRRYLSHILSARGLKNPVLSFEELGVDAEPALVGTVAA